MTTAVEADALLHVRNGFYRPAVPHLRQVGSQGGFFLQNLIWEFFVCVRVCQSFPSDLSGGCAARARAPLRGRRRHDYTCYIVHTCTYIHTVTYMYKISELHRCCKRSDSQPPFF